MKRQTTLFLIIISLLCSGWLLWASRGAQGKTGASQKGKDSIRGNQHGGQPMPPVGLRGAAATDYLKQQGLYDSLNETMRTARYSVNWAARSPLPGDGGAHEAVNVAQGYRAYFTPEGVTMTGRANGTQWQTGLRLRAVGRNGQLASVSQAEVSAHGTRASLQRQITSQIPGQIEEWYENRADGLEQGFTLAARPAGTGAEVTLALDVTGDLRVQAAGTGLELSGAGARLLYDGLRSWDATGRALATRLEVKGQEVRLAVADAGAVYPVTIDPTIAQVKQITAVDGAASDQFGVAVAMDGDTLVIGANGKDGNFGNEIGSVYVFSRNQGGANNWGLVKQISASDGVGGDQFGRTVGVDGDTIVVGAFLDNIGMESDQGSAYVFSRNQGGANNWGEVKKLTASDGKVLDQFGAAVDVDGDTIVVGSPNDIVAGNDKQGSAFVFSRNQGGANNWGQVKKLSASDGDAFDLFGNATAINGDTIVIGAFQDDAGPNVNQGSAYVFSRNQGGANNWGQLKKLTAIDGALRDFFGNAVAVDGDTIVVGVISDDVGANADQGSAYVFSRNQGGANNWGQVKQLTAEDGATSDQFGSAVAVNGDKIVIGAFTGDVGTNSNQGAAYVFSRNQGGANNWGQLKKLTARDGAADDLFGAAVAVVGDTMVIGAYGDDVGANSDQGSAFVFDSVDNTEPTITPGSLSRTAGAGSSNSQIATVGDAEDAENALTITATPVTGSGVTLSSISTDASGNVTANVATTCSATTSTFTLQVTDSGSLSATATLTVTVNTNQLPTLSYPANPGTVYGTGITVTPLTGPSDDVGVTSVVVQSITPSDPGGITVASNGVVSIANNVPVGTYTVTIRANAACGNKDASFTLGIVKATPTITWNNPADITYGTALSATQLNATPNTPGTFSYSPASGTVLNAGNAQNLTVNFTPTDTANFNATSKTVQLNVLRAPLTVTVNPIWRNVNEANPPLTGTLTGLVNGDLVTVSYSTTATIISPPGAYPITATLKDPGNRLSNYQVTNTPGTLTVQASCGFTVSPVAMAPAFLALPYTQGLTVLPVGTHTFSLQQGSLPPGLQLVNTGGVFTLQGTPTTPGTYSFTLKAVRSGVACETLRTYVMTIAPSVVPRLNCLVYNANGTITAWFGYENATRAAVTIPVGWDNYFAPGAQNQGQVTTFQVGVVNNAFSVTYPNVASFTQWTLKGPDGLPRAVLPTGASPRCP